MNPPSLWERQMDSLCLWESVRVKDEFPLPLGEG
jgi:hypothetical protein